MLEETAKIEAYISEHCGRHIRAAYPKECCQTRKDIEKRMCRVLAEQKGAK